MHSTFSSPKKNSGSDLVIHAWVVLNTITLVLFMLIDKPLPVQNSFKAFRCLCGSSGESEITTISSPYSNICIAIRARCAPEPPNLSMYYDTSSTKSVGDTRHPCFMPIVLATASDKPLEDHTFPDTDS